MPRALIAEDEPLLAAALQHELAQAWPELQVEATVGDGASAVHEALARRPDVLFLDIRMPGMSGLEAASALAEDWPDDGPFPLVVFVTAYDQYAMQAFEAQAVDYVLKPVQPQRLARTCERLAQRLREREAARATPGAAGMATDAVLAEALAQLRGLMAAPSPAPAAPPLTLLQASVGSTLHMVGIDEVIYFEAADKYVRVLTAGREYLLRTALRELLPRLDPQVFWQVHRSIVVRSTAIHSVVRDEAGKLFLQLRQRPERLPVSRMYAHLFKAM
jgi:DNA-binding LytR/AlgR family response regulator